LAKQNYHVPLLKFAMRTQRSQINTLKNFLLYGNQHTDYGRHEPKHAVTTMTSGPLLPVFDTLKPHR